ncbi:MAG: cell envelope integrity protein CreD [Candidatus Competibacteraceae bacterium]|nr:MAG: cell envelope integrity protein CreD [Candidatus Competibacteraceae bacterium]
MRNPLFVKVVLVFLVTVVLATGLSQIDYLVRERTQRRDQVVAGIAAATARDQTLVGPLLVIPYTRIVKTQKPIQSEEGKTVEVERRYADRLYLLPAELDVQANLNTEQIRRSLYHAVVFGGAVSFKGRFAAEGELRKPDPNEQIEFGEPRLIVAISDPRGILRVPVLTWGGQRLDFLPGTGEDKLPNGIQARLTGLDLQHGWSAEFEFALDLRGTQSFDVAPVGDTTRIDVRGNWPHPSFYGQFLPESRQVSDAGFSAAWSTTRLATNMLHQLNARLRGGQSLDTLIGVRFVDPADSYTQTDRAIKYGLLFIGLTFAAFFLFEVLKRLAIHPFQYGLAGTALVLFYLLLLSLSEHVGFGIAYVIATAGCVALLAYYLSFVLGSLGWGLGFGALIGAVFGILYVLISLEDLALLAGSVTLFGALALVMALTRKVDWYQLGDALGARRGKGSNGE